MSKFLDITSDTRTFAQSGHDYILTNEQGLTFDNVDIRKHEGCVVNVEMETISPQLPIGVLTKSPYDVWVEPDRQLTPEEVKNFERIG